MLKKYLKNCGKPEGVLGNIAISSMNSGHEPLCNWMLESVKWKDGDKVLDVGCGGGANILRMFKKYPNCHIDGVDFSQVSVEKSKKVNEKMLGTKCNISLGDVMQLPYSNNTYNIVTAIETIYFWKDPIKGCKQIKRVLKKDGKIIIICEISDPVKGQKWSKYNDDMKIYTKDQLKEILQQVGFDNIKIHENNTWICVEGQNT